VGFVISVLAQGFLLPLAVIIFCVDCVYFLAHVLSRKQTLSISLVDEIFNQHQAWLKLLNYLNFLNR